MFVVNAHALETVDLLHLVYEVAGKRLHSLDSQDVVGINRAIGENLTCLDAVTLLDRDVLRLGNEVLTRLADVRRNDDLALTAGILSEINDAIDIANNCWILRLARLKKLNNPRKTAGDILGLRRCALSLGDDVTGIDVRVMLDDQAHANREVVHASVAALTVDNDAWTEVAALILRLNDFALHESGALVCALLHRVLAHINPLNAACKLAQDRNSERIPLCDKRPCLDLLAALNTETGSVHERMALALTAISLINDKNVALAAHHYGRAITTSRNTHALELNLAAIARLKRGRLCTTKRRSSDVERSHGELGSRLSDRLGGNYSDRLSDVHKMPSGEVTAVAQRANASLRLTGEH